ncbi:MAG: HEPN domain-containing protein [Proteobacteria bacterium]|nr:HEPN domain-containing protein [Pseudomonadota bacterium]
MQFDPKKEGKRWYDQAVRDIDDARYNLAGGRHNLACFVAQQAAEKSLKAFLITRGEEEPWGHSVAELCRSAAQIDPTFTELQPRVAPLDKYYIPTRYPNGLPGGIPSEAFSRDDALSAIGLADSLIQQIGNKLSPK